MKFRHLILILFWCFTAAAEVIPPAPKEFFNDYANVTSAATGKRLNDTLRQFERDTSSQIWVVIYPTMQTESSMEDYTVRVYRSWKVGLQGKDNGAVLFVFVKEHKLRIATGYGLEGALPDVLCKRILDNEITPRLKQGDFDGGMSAGVMAMIAAAKGEYKGTGRTVADNAAGNRGQDDNSGVPLTFILGLVGMVVLVSVLSLLRLTSSRSGGMGGTGWWIAANVIDSVLNSRSGGWSSGGGGGGWGGGSSGGGDSGAMGGGGSTGGGGASGNW